MKSNTKYLRILVLMSLMAFSMFLGTTTATEEADYMDNAPHNSVYFNFGAALPNSYWVNYNALTSEELTVWLRDCCIRDDVVEVYVDGVYIGTVDSRGGGWGTHPWQSVTTIIPAGWHLLEFRNTISGVGPSGWYYDLEAEPYWIPVCLDIKPGSDPNSVNLRSRGVLPMCICGVSIDVTTIDPASLNIEGVGLATRGSKKAPKLAYSIEDLNEDGYPELVAFFNVQDLVDAGVLTGTTTSLTLSGSTTDGWLIEGTDSVRIVPPH